MGPPMTFPIFALFFFHDVLVWTAVLHTSPALWMTPQNSGLKEVLLPLSFFSWAHHYWSRNTMDYRNNCKVSNNILQQYGITLGKWEFIKTNVGKNWLSELLIINEENNFMINHSTSNKDNKFEEKFLKIDTNSSWSVILIL